MSAVAQRRRLFTAASRHARNTGLLDRANRVGCHDVITARASIARVSVYKVDSPSSTQMRFLSIDSSPESIDLTKVSVSDLKQLALKHSRQEIPIQAHAVLEKLKQEHPDENLEDIETSIIDAWIRNQNLYLGYLNDSIASQEATKVQENFLEEIADAAEAASQIVESMKDPSPHHFIAVLNAWANVCEAAHKAGLTKSDSVRGIPQRTQHLLQLQPKPSMEAYNAVLKAWGYSGEYLRGTMSDQVFKKISDPNGESFRLIIRSWCWSNERRCAFTATGYFMRMMRLLEIGRRDMEPTMDDYHILFRAWTKSEDKNAPSKVRTVLQIAETAYRKDSTELRPDEQCFRDTLVTMSRRINVPEVGELVDETLSEMKVRLMIPDTECYSAAISAWKNVAISRDCDDREKAARRALELLEEMTKAYHRTTEVTIKPTIDNYNHVLEALAFSKSPKATESAEILLSALENAMNQKQEGSCDTVTDQLGPSAESYTHALQVWRNSKKPNKVAHAVDVLQRFRERLDHIKSTSNSSSIVAAYSAFIQVCANCHVSKEDDALRTKVMATVLRTANEMRTLDGLQPDSTTYTALIEAGDKLMPDGKERRRLLENIFAKACDAGHVDQALLEQFKAAASSYSYAKVVIARSREVENIKVVPESWTRNISAHMANAKGGRQVLPLSIDGTFTFTKAAAEYKMRKLRRRSNQKMLQGGRT